MMKILITGGTGSFGRALTGRLAGQCDRLVIYSRDEQKQEAMAREFAGRADMRFFIGDVRDLERLKLAMRGIDTVVHAAALKIIPTCEYNPTECVHTNIIGAENVVRAALSAGVSRVVALSTDKACGPVNLYGSTKLAAEKIFSAANNLGGDGGCHFSCVRYGNVADSRGSVIPFFKALAQDGKPLPITDIRMTRFWITLEQAVDFVLSSMLIMRGREIFIPKLPCVRIITLASAIGRLYGKSAEQHRTIVGIRPGEKLHETLLTVDESRNARELPDRYIVEPEFAGEERPAYMSSDGPFMSATDLLGHLQGAPIALKSAGRSR